MYYWFMVEQHYRVTLCYIKTRCPLGNFSCFCRLLIFSSKSTVLKSSFRDTIRMSNSLDTDQARHFVGPDLAPNCLKKISADDTKK